MTRVLVILAVGLIALGIIQIIGWLPFSLIVGGIYLGAWAISRT
jgi:hypothetical protein